MVMDVVDEEEEVGRDDDLGLRFLVVWGNERIAVELTDRL